MREVTSRDVPVPTRLGAVAARLYEPRGGAGRSVLVFPGVHAGGIDEPRLVTFSRRLASTGLNVLSVPLPDLREFRVTARSTDIIEDATLWLAADRALAPSGRVGLVGVSFAGGLALVAAGRPSLAGKVQFVVSLGGHADLPRVMTYLCTGRLPDGAAREPHAYGIVIILLGALEHLVPADQVEPLRAAVLTFLDASSFDQTNPEHANELFARARTASAQLPEPARTYMQWVNDRTSHALGDEAVAARRGARRRGRALARSLTGDAGAGVSVARRRGQRHSVVGDAARRILPRRARQHACDVAPHAAAHPRDRER